MRKSQKEMLLLAAGVMLASSLAGCGSKEANGDKPVDRTTTASAETKGAGNSSEAAGAYADYSNGFDERVTIEIPVYDRAFEGWNVKDNYYTKWIQSEFGDKYNVDVNFVSVGRSTEVQDYMQMIAAGNAPDIIMHYNMPQAVNYYNEGAIQDIDLEELAYYAPNYYERIKDTISTYGVLDGNNAFFFAERNPIYYHVVILIRQDWLDQVGMENPKNLAELEAVGSAWREAGLGSIGATLGTAGSNSGLLVKDFIFEYPYLDEVDASEYPLYLDLDVAPFTWAPTKAYLKAQNDLYNKGILDSEFYLNKEDNDTKADFVSGNTGTYLFTINSNTDVITSLLANDPDAKVSILSPEALSPTGSAAYYQYPPYGMIMGVNHTTSDEERAALWMYLDWLSQPENLFFIQNGIEDETYNLSNDGIAIAVPDYKGEAKLSNNMNKDYWCLVQELVDYGDAEKNLAANLSRLAPVGYENLIMDNYEIHTANAGQGIISPIFTETVASISEYRADLNSKWQQFYVDCVTCKPEEFEAKYEEYSELYLEAGYQEILDEKQALLDEGKYISGTE